MIYPREAPPGYLELADILRRRIASGQIAPGQIVASEGRLAQEYGVATKTARAALQQLRDEGLAELRRGYGVVVRQPVEPEEITPEPGSMVWGANADAGRAGAVRRAGGCAAAGGADPGRADGSVPG